MSGRRNTVEDVWRRIDQRDADECWPFIGAVNTNGYGQISLNGKQRLVHRAVFEESTGMDPGDLLVCHACDNPRCCNPAHLFLGTSADNMSDASAKGRLPGSPKLTSSEVREIRRIAATGVSYYRLGKLFGVSDDNISHIVRRISWRSVA